MNPVTPERVISNTTNYMTELTPDLMPILSSGAHPSPKEGACVMEYASLLAGEEWSDHPACTHPVLASVARLVNDHLDDEARQSLLPLLPRLMGTAETGTADERHRLRVGLAVWCAERVVHLAGEAEPEALAAIRVTRAWLAGDVTGDARTAAPAARAAAKAAAANGAKVAAYAAYAAYDAYAANAAADAYAANAAACAAYAAYAANDAKVAFLTGLIDEYDRLTGRTQPAPLTPSDLRTLADATGA